MYGTPNTQSQKKPGFFAWVKRRLVKKASPDSSGSRTPNIRTPNIPQVYGPSTRAQWTPPNLGVPGTQVKFATTQLSTGQVIPAPHVMTPIYAHVRAPTKWAQNSMFTPKGTLESMESVFR